MPNLGPLEIIAIILVVLLLFGAKKLPDLARSVGRSARILKSEVKEMNNDDNANQAPQQGQLTSGTAATKQETEAEFWARPENQPRQQYQPQQAQPQPQKPYQAPAQPQPQQPYSQQAPNQVPQQAPYPQQPSQGGPSASPYGAQSPQTPQGQQGQQGQHGPQGS